MGSFFVHFFVDGQTNFAIMESHQTGRMEFKAEKFVAKTAIGKLYQYGISSGLSPSGYLIDVVMHLLFVLKFG